MIKPILRASTWRWLVLARHSALRVARSAILRASAWRWLVLARHSALRVARSAELRASAWRWLVLAAVAPMLATCGSSVSEDTVPDIDATAETSDADTDATAETPDAVSSTADTDPTAATIGDEKHAAGDDDSAPSVVDASDLLSHAEPGPYAVGVTALDPGDSEDNKQIVVRYPVDADAVTGLPVEAIPVADYTDPTLLRLLPDTLQDSSPPNAYRDATPARGAFPIIIENHPVLEPSRTHSFISNHLASWGFVVASMQGADRDSGSFAAFIRRYLHGSMLDKDITDLVHAISKVQTELGDQTDTRRVGVLGHDYSARAAFSTLALPTVSTGFFWSVPQDSTSWPNFIFPGGSKPVTLIGLGNDTLVPAHTARALYDAMWGPRTYFTIEGVGSNTLSDFCRLVWPHGDAMDAASVYYDELDFLRITEGCGDGFIDPVLAQAVLKHATAVHFLRELTGEDVSLEAGFADGTGVEISDFTQTHGGERPTPEDLSATGPHEVNIITLPLSEDSDDSVDLYYPAAEFFLQNADTDMRTYAELFPLEIRSEMPEGFDEPVNPTAYYQGPFAAEWGLPRNVNLAHLQGIPLIVNVAHSHTLAKRTNRVLNTHLASWGLVVAQITYEPNSSDETDSPPGDDLNREVDQTLASIPIIVGQIDAMGRDVYEDVTTDTHFIRRIGVFGHATGADAALRSLPLGFVDAALALSPVGIAETCASGCSGDESSDALMLVIAGDDVEDERSEAAAVLNAHSGPGHYFEIPEAGMNSFADACNAYYRYGTRGEVASILGSTHPDEEFDGCTKDFADPAEVHKAVAHLATTFFLRELAEVDIATDVPDSLDIEVIAGLQTN